jgi:glyceraldehyde-3-phosphate dehydrogenase (NAD(P))
MTRASASVEEDVARRMRCFVLMADRGRPHDNLYEVALWADMLTVHDDEVFYAYMVDNQAIVIPETIDAIRALTHSVDDASESIARTNAALGIETTLI